MVSIFNLPDELVEFIASFIDSPKDLLHFALTHSRAKRIIIPFYIDYRILHYSYLGSSYLWHRLVKRPDLARRFREFEAVNPDFKPQRYPRYLIEGDCGLPEFTPGDSGKEAQSFLSGLSRMTGLVKSRLFSPAASIMDALDTFGAFCPNLENLVLCPVISLVDILPRSVDNPLTFVSLRSIDILGEMWMASQADAILHILAHHSFPKLEVLMMAWRTLPFVSGFPALLTNGTWPELKIFKFQDLRCSDVPFYDTNLDNEGKREVFSSFLIRHPKLEEFVAPCTPMDLWCGVHFRTSAGSHLHTIGMEGNYMVDRPLPTLFDPDMLPRLKKLACSIGDTCLDTLQQMENLQELIATVEKDLLTRFLDSVPSSVVRLQINLRRRDFYPVDLRRHISQLQRLQNLTHLGGIFVDLEGNLEMVDDVWKRLSALPELRFVGIDTMENIWVGLSRFKDSYPRNYNFNDRGFISDIFTWYPGNSMKSVD